MPVEAFTKFIDRSTWFTVADKLRHWRFIIEVSGSCPSFVDISEIHFLMDTIADMEILEIDCVDSSDVGRENIPEKFHIFLENFRW